MAGDNQQEIMDLGFALIGTHQKGISILLRELIFRVGFETTLQGLNKHDVSH